ncbi:MAG: response regulator [Verrucomicrobia bacterium]|nr:response regulator [Verrucomicrobiota bacterium]
MSIASAWTNLLKEENKRLTLRNIRTLCLFGMTMVPACTILDKFAYPDLWWEFFIIRAVAAAFMIAILTLSYTDFGSRNYRILVLLIPLVPLVTVASMIWRSGEPSSPYYAGLTLVLVGFGFLFQWSYVESLIAVLFTLLIYLVATVPHLPAMPFGTPVFGQFVNNTMFLILNSIIIVTGCRVHQRIRENEVVSRYRLADSRKELEEKHLELIEMDRLKSDFFSNVTHELRTPLTLILAPLQRLLRQSATSQTETVQDKLEVHEEISGIYQNSLRLLKLINELLNFSSVDARRLRIEHEAFRMDEFLDRITRSIRNMAEQGRVTLTQDRQMQLSMVRGDEEKLEKILLNLLFNAVKFTPGGGRVDLQINQHEDEIIFEVADTGVGIPAASLPFIFDRFWQADTSATRRHTGTGLGLSLVKEFAEAMGGRVEAESQVGVGTTLRVILPCLYENAVPVIGLELMDVVPVFAVESSDTAEPSPALGAWIRSIHREADQACVNLPESLDLAEISIEAEATSDRASLPLVLIADDEPDMLRFMRKELEAKYRIIEVADGYTALEAALQHRPDLVIADYMMPNLDGLALCHEIRTSEQCLRTPIMLVTARSDEAVRLNALHLGANDVLVKPFSLSEFNSRVHNLVENHLLERKVESRNIELEKTLGELRAAERELIQSEKMAALGILTAGIMHEINNPLNFTRSALYVLERRAAKLRVENSSEIIGMIADLREGVSRVSTIVADLRGFCHPEELVASDCSIAEPLQSAVRLLAGPFRESSVILEDDVPETLTVRGDKNQLTLVFLNLLKNALDALSTTTVSSGDQRQIRVSASARGADLVEVSVTDNGPGIPMEHLTHIFDPFFTTKAPGEGTGLGLSICYRIISAHGGAITANSQPGLGTQFTIRLARVSAEERSIPEQLPVLSA